MDLRSKFHWNPKRLVPPLALMVIAIGYLSQVGSFGDHTAAEAPELYGTVLFGLSILVFLLALLPSAKAREKHNLIQHTEEKLDWKIAVQMFVAVAAFIAFVFIAGFYVAIPLFLVLFLNLVSRMSLITSASFAVVALALTWFLFSYVLSLEVFTGYLANYF